MVPSIDPAARSTPFGCQAMDVIVFSMLTFKCLHNHQSFSSSKCPTTKDPLEDPTANLVPLVFQATHVAPLEILGPNNEVLKHKVRLVARGYTQLQGENFDETFAPVTDITEILILLTIAAKRK